MSVILTDRALADDVSKVTVPDVSTPPTTVGELRAKLCPVLLGTYITSSLGAVKVPAVTRDWFVPELDIRTMPITGDCAVYKMFPSGVQVGP